MPYENGPNTLTLLKRRCARGRGQLLFVVVVVLFMTITLYIRRNIGETNDIYEIENDFPETVRRQYAMVTGDPMQSKLMESELNWLEKNALRNEAELALKTEEDLVILANGLKKTKFWSFFNASFECPYSVERVGRKTGDGGKWVCGFEEIIHKPKCVVYSFGIFHESTFEEEVTRRTNCTVHMFEWDEKIAAPSWAAEFPGKVTYTNIGIGNKNGDHYRTLRTFMETNGDDYADIFKIDVEGWEWPSLDQILKDYPDKLPFGQMQVEVHVHLFKPKDQYIAMRNFWFSLEQAGLRPFYREYNMPLYFEFSFLNIRQDLFRLEEDVNSKLMKWTWDPKYHRSMLENIQLDFNN